MKRSSKDLLEKPLSLEIIKIKKNWQRSAEKIREKSFEGKKMDGGDEPELVLRQGLIDQLNKGDDSAPVLVQES